jgi:excisionase family DNA binding protein
MLSPMPPRFLQLADVAEILNISSAQAYALVRSGDLPAIKVGGRGQWRVESEQLEGYIQRMYAATREFVVAHPRWRHRRGRRRRRGLTEAVPSDPQDCADHERNRSHIAHVLGPMGQIDGVLGQVDGILTNRVDRPRPAARLDQRWSQRPDPD